MSYGLFFRFDRFSLGDVAVADASTGDGDLRITKNHCLDGHGPCVQRHYEFCRFPDMTGVCTQLVGDPIVGDSSVATAVKR